MNYFILSVSTTLSVLSQICSTTKTKIRSEIDRPIFPVFEMTFFTMKNLLFAPYILKLLKACFVQLVENAIFLPMDGDCHSSWKHNKYAL